MSLEMRHMCPNAPDTLRTFPFRETDPFVIEKSPDVYFAGCQSSYGSKLVQQPNTTQAVRLISVPSFAKTMSIVLLDVNTLDSYELIFG